jgi:secondary thiamine-phosphate synthase enzyme
MSSSRMSRTPLVRSHIDTITSAVLSVQTPGAGFIDITADVAAFAVGALAQQGTVTVFVRHTSASLTVQENADPSVLHDLKTTLNHLAPEDADWTHDTEGPDDMPAMSRPC